MATLYLIFLSTVSAFIVSSILKTIQRFPGAVLIVRRRYRPRQQRAQEQERRRHRQQGRRSHRGRHLARGCVITLTRSCAILFTSSSLITVLGGKLIILSALLDYSSSRLHNVGRKRESIFPPPIFSGFRARLRESSLGLSPNLALICEPSAPLPLTPLPRLPFPACQSARMTRAIRKKKYDVECRESAGKREIFSWLVIYRATCRQAF